jgi:hypothetical protein
MSTREFAGRILLLLLLGFAPFDAWAQYRHKSESDIAALAPAQRVDEFANEQAYHKYDLLDQQHELISKHILRDGLKALPRMIEIMNEYDPATTNGKTGHKGERFDAMWMLLDDLDNHVARLRASPQGAQAIEALARAIQRMRAAGYGREDQHEWAEHGRFDLAVMALEDAKGTNGTDEAIKDTLWANYKLKLSGRELLSFSNFLVGRDPTYPSWSETDFIKDYSRVNSAGNPAQVYVMKKPTPFYKAYLDFKKSKI